MNNQLALFEFKKNGEAHARRTDPDTSHLAATEIKGDRATQLEREVLAALKRNPQGLTMHEICSETGLRWNTASPRIRPLYRKGLVFDSGERRKGLTNKTCIIWKAIQ